MSPQTPPVQQVLTWAQSNTCLQQTLVGYFGEQLAEPCGQCSVCRGQQALIAQRQTIAPDLTAIKTLQAEAHPALASPRQQARLLCGISSPQASRARLSKHPLFGALAASSFEQVLAACSELQI